MVEAAGLGYPIRERSFFFFLVFPLLGSFPFLAYPLLWKAQTGRLAWTIAWMVEAAGGMSAVPLMGAMAARLRDCATPYKEKGGGEERGRGE
jgi:hypothetical protein